MMKRVLVGLAISAGVAHGEPLRVMKTGLGDGSITGPAGINCGTGGATCNADLTGLVTLNVTVPAGSTLTWGGDCAAVPSTTLSCTVNMNATRSVRANFAPATSIPPITDFSPGGIEDYLNLNTAVDTSAEFVAALPQEFRENWILMPRSESLQPGTARYPRILLASADATRVFTLTIDPDANSSYPAAHRNAIEYMQFVGGTDNNFHFHEIVLAPIPALGDDIDPGPAVVLRYPPRDRGTDPVNEDDARCFACHSTRNVIHHGGPTAASNTPGTTGDPRGSVKFKTRPNWDTYDSWGGMLAFNRDRIFRGTVEAAAFRATFNLWTWQNDDAVRAVIEQLALQPAGVPAGHRITRWDTVALGGGASDGHIQFAFDPAPPAIVSQEPQPFGAGPSVAYNFDRLAGTTGTNVRREPTEAFVTLHHSCQPTSDEGRGVELFDRLTGGRPAGDQIGPACPAPAPGDTIRPNPDRIADELISHSHATGSVAIDVRPIALAIASSCITVGGGSDVTATQSVAGLPASALGFFDERNGMNFNDVYDDTRRRGQSLPRRKADIARTTLDRDADLHVFDPAPFDGTPIGDTPDRVDGLIREFGDQTLGVPGGTGGQDRSFPRVRQEVFRRDLPPGHYDETVVGRFYIDREDDSTDGTGDNTAPVALYRYFLEPLGVSVDKWSMGVRGRSRTYTFADILTFYTSTLQLKLSASLGLPTGAGACAAILPLVNAELARLPAATAVPTYTDMQRIFNKACIECHGGLGYPPYQTYGTSFDLTENENPRASERRLWRSLEAARRRTGVPTCAPGVPTCTVGTGTDPLTSGIFRRITDGGRLRHPYSPGLPHNIANPDDPTNPDVADERCPGGLMPCEGPPLSKTDIETVRRWILGGHPNTEGDPHIKTVDGVRYDFQSAGEFILLRGEGLELQARQTPVTTAGAVGPDAHTGLTSCVSLNTAVAMRVGLDRVTYQPELAAVGGDGDLTRAKALGQRKRLRLRVNGKDIDLGPDGIVLASGGRIARTTVADGIEIHVPGGEGIVITPAWWDYYQVWYMNIEVRHARSTEGVMGAIPPGTWLPALSNGALIGARAADLAQRHTDLYETFANSWRVDATTSLFDYEAGLTPQMFVVDTWPVAAAQQCVAPPQPGGPVSRAAPPAIARAQAETLCQGLVEVERRSNCVADVMATGEPGFARTYAASEALERRVMPGAPVLVSPQDHVRIAARPIDFTWTARPGAEGIDVVYRHCLWRGDENFDLERCVKLPGGTPSSGSLVDRLKHRFGLLLWIVLLVLLLIAVLLVLRYRGKGAVFAVLLVAAVLAVLVLLARARAGGTRPRTSHVASGVQGKEYSWKVIAETRDGVIVESETYRLEVAP
jgi:mono/diheme cytochrome c family protein